MAEAGVHLDKSESSCSMCLALPKDPVTIPCGHSYCMDCIKDYWDQEDHVGVYRCPQCRQILTPRPVPGRNTMLARAEKQDQVELMKKEVQQKIQQREKEVQKLRQAVDSLTRSAQAALEDTESIFAEMIRSIERRRSEVRDLIRAQEKAAISRAEGLQKQVEQEIAELKRRHSELEQILHSEDHIHFLQKYQCLCAPPGSGDLSSITVSPHCSFEDVRILASKMKQQLEDFCRNELIKTLQQMKEVHIVDPRTREDFVQYACQLIPNTLTMNCKLSASEWGTVVTRTEEPQLRFNHPERFDYWSQVLCREGLAGRSYWEVEWSGRGADIAVAYKGIRRKGNSNDCRFGCNDKSWRLTCSSAGYSVRHGEKETAVHGPCSSRIGVYLDHRAGTLSFYSISEDTMTLLHRVQTTFTEPLYPGFCVWPHTCVKLCSEL